MITSGERIRRQREGRDGQIGNSAGRWAGLPAWGKLVISEGAADAVKEGEQDDSADNEKAQTLSEYREGDGDGEKDQRGDGGDPRAEKNADAEQAEDDASDENYKAVAGVALGGGRHKRKNQG
jgi:hypothetical protein